jgi:predicted small lipoprotein YifL
MKPWPDIVMRLLRIVMFSALCATLTACGNKGPLVLPDKKPSTTPTQPDKSPSQDSAKQP